MNHEQRAVVYQKRFAFKPVKCAGNRWVWLKTYRTKTTVLGMTAGLFEIGETLKLTNADAVFDRLRETAAKIIDN
jgi:hypothetical protein